MSLEERHWFVFYTKSRQEKKVQELLTRRGYEVFLPLEKVMRQWSDRKRTVEVPLFNSYIFVSVLAHQIQEVLQVPGIAWNIRHNGKPAVLYPKEYVSRLLKLKKLGVKVTVYNELKLKKLGMNSLLGVGRGSAKESYLVTMEWFGNKKNKSSPLSFVGKGVCFDTGGISLKPAKFMEEMKYDMAGSAVVAGLIQSLAMRKSKVNAVGVVGLVENMPGGNAQRPGDIVKAYNGKTIEVLNTDAEGRLVLADALSFTEKKFKPKFIIDLATLTGAIIVALGEEYGGLFSNNNDL